MNHDLRNQNNMAGFDEEAWYECSSCGSLMYGFQDSCWACGVMLSYDRLRMVDLYE